MAFVDSTNGGRIVTGGTVAGPVLLDKDAVVGDLLAPAGRDGWVPAAGENALLIAAASAPAGSVVSAYRVATIEFGPDCDAVPGDPVYAATDPPGGYTATAGTGGAPIGRMLTPSSATITPNAIPASEAPPVGRDTGAGDAPVWDVALDVGDARDLGESATVAILNARLARLVTDLQDQGVLRRPG